MANRQFRADPSNPASPMAGLADIIQRPSAPPALDDLDRAILSELLADSRLSQRQLAKAVGMSAPAVGDRITRLVRLGVIRRHTIDIDWSAVGLPMSAYIPMVVTTGADLRAIIDRLRSIPELDELQVVTGSYDLIARFRLRDHSHLIELLLDQMWQTPGLQRVETFLSLGEVTAGDDVALLKVGRRADIAEDSV